jgi:hypothetical protein
MKRFLESRMREIRMSGSTRGEWVALRCRPLSYSTVRPGFLPTLFLERVIEVCLQICEILHSHGKPDQSIGDAERRALL